MDTSVGLWVALVAVVVSLYAAISARRSAAAAERSALAAETSAQAGDRSAAAEEESTRILRDRERSEWVSRFADVMPDLPRVSALLREMPEWLRPEWREVLERAAGRSPQMTALWPKYVGRFEDEWRRAAETREKGGEE